MEKVDLKKIYNDSFSQITYEVFEWMINTPIEKLLMAEKVTMKQLKDCQKEREEIYLEAINSLFEERPKWKKIKIGIIKKNSIWSSFYKIKNNSIMLLQKSGFDYYTISIHELKEKDFSELIKAINISSNIFKYKKEHSYRVQVMKKIYEAEIDLKKYMVSE